MLWVETISFGTAQTHVPPQSKRFCHVSLCWTKTFISNINSADAWLDILCRKQHQQHLLYEQKWSASEQHKRTFYLGANISVMCICAWLKSSYRKNFVRTLDWTFSAGERINRMGCMRKTIGSWTAQTHVLPRSKYSCHVYSCLTKIFISKKIRADAWPIILGWWTHHQYELYLQKRSAIEQHNHTFHLGPNGSVMCYCAGLKLLYQI